MAELDIRQPESNIYGNVEDCEALPLFVRNFSSVIGDTQLLVYSS